MGRRFWRRKWILRKYYFQLVKDGVSKIYTYTALFTRGPECYVLMMNNLYYLSTTNDHGGITPPYRHYWSIIKFGYFDVFCGKLNHKEQFYAAKYLRESILHPKDKPC